MYLPLNVVMCMLCICLTSGVTLGTLLESNQTIAIVEGRKMVFPTLSTMQLSICTSSGTPFFVPKKKYPFRRLGMNIGFQVNYNLPFRLKEFYNFPTWARAMVDIVKGRFMPTEVITSRAARRRSSSSQLSAGDVYTALEEILQLNGYDKDCAVKSVCELAHSPFHDRENDLFAEILHFFLTPSDHQAFDKHDSKLKNKYELAEKLGQSGSDCNMLYPKCRTSFLEDMSGFEDDIKMQII